jgi:lipopolysaccharide export LptBFGC system permease protein LptF
VDNDYDRVLVTIELHDAQVSSETGPIPRASFPRSFSIPMPREVLLLRQARTADYYVAGPEIRSQEHRRLKREYHRLSNSIYSEMHARASLAVSCMVLVMVGCALGLMFRSGNFLTAFALSVVPALLTIALIVMGQKTAENIPWELETLRDPLWLGVGLIWSGNVAVLAIGVVLLGRLQRQ